jgi:hypothetical protein
VVVTTILTGMLLAPPAAVSAGAIVPIGSAIGILPLVLVV